MTLIKYFIMQFILCSTLILTWSISDKYSNNPLRLIAAGIITYLILTLHQKVRKHFKSVHVPYEIVLFLLALIISSVLIGFLMEDGIWQ